MFAYSHKGSLSGSIAVPGSKSQTIRGVLFGMLATTVIGIFFGTTPFIPGTAWPPWPRPAPSAPWWTRIGRTTSGWYTV